MHSLDFLESHAILKERSFYLLNEGGSPVVYKREKVRGGPGEPDGVRIVGAGSIEGLRLSGSQANAHMAVAMQEAWDDYMDWRQANA